MKGIIHVEISNRDAKFKFDLYRNITIVRGESGTGKTTLFDMVTSYTRNADKSGINISCQRKCVALIDSDWKHQLKGIKASIVFVDEGAEYLKTKEFASAIKNTDNYYVFFTRENLHYIPYSVDEIYEIKMSGRYHTFKKIYKVNSNHIYYTGRLKSKFSFDKVLTEDSKSGYQFFESYLNSKGVQCFTSKSNSAIFSWLKKHSDDNVFIIADGAAFGSEIDRVLKLNGNIRLCLPESFEWLILKSVVVKIADLDAVLSNPSDYIDSKEFFSWEQFFSKYLINSTGNTPFQYSKDKINPVYLQTKNAVKIISEIIYPFI